MSDPIPDDVLAEPDGTEEPGHIPAEVPEADAIEQRQPVTSGGGDPHVPDHPTEASAADVWEQQRDADLDEEDSPR
jgi:hypothetical protein